MTSYANFGVQHNSLTIYNKCTYIIHEHDIGEKFPRNFSRSPHLIVMLVRRCKLIHIMAWSVQPNTLYESFTSKFVGHLF